MAAMDSRMGMGVSAHPQPYPNLPASPTLTNPDMILPDYDFALSPGLDDDDEDRPARSQSPLMMWKNTHAASSSTDLQQLFAGSQEHHHAFPSGPITPTTPIIYGNGTMLSDIGEVTEVESTVGPSPSSARRRAAGGANSGPYGMSGSPSGSRTPSPTPLPHNIRHPFHHNRDNFSDAPRQSSPTMGAESGQSILSSNNSNVGTIGVKQRARQQQQQQADRGRRDSLESNSTITTQDQAGLFADFDDAVSVGDDSVFQGDDEESVAESYVEETYIAREVPITSTASSSLLAVPDFGGGGGSSSGGNTSDEGERRLSAATLSLRAEKILANAKKRLTTMEGNLNRARSSLYISSPPAGSLPSDGSTPSPRTPVRSATASSRYHDPSPGSPIHSRMVSDGSMPIDGVVPGNFLQRSASALGAAGGYRKPQLTGSRSADRVDEIQDSLSGGYHRAGLNKPVDIVLERLDEDGADDTDILPAHDRSSGQLESFLSPTFGSANGDKGLTRSASVAQMRDLKDQMKGLKGKISTLREQARADSLKRRSLQSLRTPSPFTHAQIDQWATGQPHVALNESPESSGNGSPAQNYLNNGWNNEQAPAYMNGEQIVTASAMDLDAVTPPPRHDGSPAESAHLSRSGGSGSSRARQSKHNSPLALDGDQTDEDSVINSRYEHTEDGMMTKLSYASVQPYQQSTESPVLGGGGPPSSPGEITTPDEEDEDLDDLHTENGDFSDEGHSLESLDDDVFVDSAVADMSGHKYQVDDENDEDDDANARGQESPSYDDQEDDIDYESESGESMYHDTLQHPISHEDREDAFDYEHFILHSALGTISQQRLARSGSFSSEDSVETTRGPVSASNYNNSSMNDDDPTFPSPNRRTSMSSISTVESADSFATATEGRTSRTNRFSTISDADDADDAEDAEDAEDVIFHHENRVAAAAAKDRPDSLLLARAAAVGSNSYASNNNNNNNNNNEDYAAATPTSRSSVEEPRQTQQPPMARRPASAVAGHRPSVSSFESTGTTRSFPLVNRNRVSSVGTVFGAGVATVNGFRSGSGGSHSLNSSISMSNGGGSGSIIHSASSTPTKAQASVSRVSPDNEELRSISESLMNETASICEQQANGSGSGSGSGDGPGSLGGKRSMSSPEDDGSLLHERSGSAGGVNNYVNGNSNGNDNGAGASHVQALQSLSIEDQYLVERLVGNLGRCVLGLSESGRASTESRDFRRRIDAARRILEGLDPV
ncbi:hypothetical protein SCUCBS95973_002096 [Sporothrix curviconia]|uniref:Uncharacterized protein n=1 Tax=Sporothrix curviconia TaxID=1260050 RepID=A0ABP0B4R0_9PEZI